MAQQKSAATKQPPPDNALKKKKEHVAVRFTNTVMANFGDYAGQPIQLTDHQKTLAQHLFIYLDNQFKTLASKHWRNDCPAVGWHNVNLSKLAVESVKVVKAGLDATIPNHVHAVPYWNKRTEQYDVNIDPGYAGRDYHIRRVSLYPIRDIRYELVYANDNFKPFKKSFNNPVESLIHEIPSPFDRGEVVGGYIYVIYEDPEQNQLFIIGDKDFQKAEASSPSGKSKDGSFWKNWPDEMKYKTLVRRAYSKITKDPEKSDSVAAFHALDPTVEDTVDRIEGEAQAVLGSGQVIDIPDEEIDPVDGAPQDERPEQEKLPWDQEDEADGH